MAAAILGASCQAGQGTLGGDENLNWCGMILVLIKEHGCTAAADLACAGLSDYLASDKAAYHHPFTLASDN